MKSPGYRGPVVFGMVRRGGAGVRLRGRLLVPRGRNASTMACPMALMSSLGAATAVTYRQSRQGGEYGENDILVTIAGRSGTRG